MTTENSMTPAGGATLADYIESFAAEGNLNSFDNNLDWSEDVRGGIAEWLKSRVNVHSDTSEPAELALDDLREVIENLEGAVFDARLFVINYFKQSGTLAKVREAIVAFDNLPTDSNRLKLAEVSLPLMWHRIEMDAATKAILRKYAINRFWRTNIYFGTVHSIATTNYNPALIVPEVA